MFGAANGVFIKRVAAVDDDVIGFEQRDEMFDKFIHRRAGLHQHHNATRPLERADHLLQRMGADHVGFFGFLVQEFIHFGNGAVKSHDFEAVVVHVENEVLAHHSQANECNVRCRLHVFYFLKVEEKRY